MKSTSLNRESNPTHSPAVLYPSATPQIADDGGDVPPRQVILSGVQQQALEWLIGGGSVTDAAEFAGVTRQTISRWLREDEDFQAAYVQWREEAAAIVRGRMVAASEAAMDAVMHAIRTKGDLRASQFVLKNFNKDHLGP